MLQKQMNKRNVSFPSLKAHQDVLGKERGWPSFDENYFEREIGSHGAIYLGSPETVAQKLLIPSKL